jgi:glutamate/tyrosine decarboxylase-like PLP-dependent enzyme
MKTQRVTETGEAESLLLSDVDWDAASWREAGRRFLELATEVSTGWDGRPPFPTGGVDIRSLFREALPKEGADISEVLRRLERDVAPLSAFNGHPSWFGYITGAALPASVLADLVASALNQNVGGWRISPAATSIELQTIDWLKEIVGFPSDAEGVFVSGGQMANIVAQAVLRDAKSPWDMRRYGARGPDGSAPRLRIYASSESHYCHEQAAEVLGLGRESVRLVPADEQYRLRTDALVSMIEEDRARGDLPIAVVGAAGTVGTGAVDPLADLLELAREQQLWFHIDGAYGAFATLAASCPAELKLLSEADSLACDPHKWLYQPIDAGVVLMREPGLLERSFQFHVPYLAREQAPSEVDLYERSPENTRPFRALKVWVALQLYGRAGLAAMIERNIQLAAMMERLVGDTDGLVLAAPRELSIVCWRVEPAGMRDPEWHEALQTDVIQALQARGIAVVSNAKLRDGRTALRACIVNFRTTEDDVRAVVEASAAIGHELAATYH